MQSIIITGATSGIGYECALHVAKMAPDQQIIVACRNLPLGQHVIEQIRQQTQHSHLICLPLDLASLQSVRDFVTLFSQQAHPNVIALINNAGIQCLGQTRYTQDGFEVTFGVNHLAPFYLTLLLLPYMAPTSSITFTASGTHDPNQKTGMPAPIYSSAQRLAYPEPTAESSLTSGQRRYTTSKLCTILTAYELQKRVTKLGIRVNAFDPGLVPGTGLAREYPPFLRFVSDYVFKLLILVHPNVHTAQRSGRNLANLAYERAYKRYAGKYVEGTKAVASSADSYRHDFQTDLWDTSVRLTGIPSDQTPIAG